MRISAGYMFFLLGDLLVANKAEEKIEKMIRGGVPVAFNNIHGNNNSNLLKQ